MNMNKVLGPSSILTYTHMQFTEKLDKLGLNTTQRTILKATGVEENTRIT